MKISFTQIYVELSTSFDLDSALLKPLAERLSALNKDTPVLHKRFKRELSALVFIITATRKHEHVEVKGPTWLRKTGIAEFAVYIPSREFSSFVEKVEYVLAGLAQGVIATLERYGSDGAGVQNIFDDLGMEVRTRPDRYKSEQDPLPVGRS